MRCLVFRMGTQSSGAVQQRDEADEARQTSELRSFSLCWADVSVEDRGGVPSVTHNAW